MMDYGLEANASEPSARRLRRNVLISGLVFLGAFVLALAPESFDRPLTRLVNGLAHRSQLFDYLVSAFSKFPTFSGVVLMALIWYCWFDDKNLESRARILVGTLASFGAGVISRSLQHTLPTHLRPYYDPALGFQRPLGLEVPSNTWDSFPSDHVAVFAGLAVVLYVAHPRLAIYSIIWTAIVESLRTYMGAHYPTDLIAGAGLAAFVVWASQASSLLSFGSKIMRWERSSPALFYMTAFFFSYQIATLFVDIRTTFGPVRDKIMFHGSSPSSRFAPTPSP